MALAAGADAPAVYANLGEVLMADGQLAAAEACYRDAIAVASSSHFSTVGNVASIATWGASASTIRGRARKI